MSSMLEQAIVDADALRETALRSAESSILEKYSYEVKEAVLKPVQRTSREPLIFKTFEKFVRWLSGSLGYSSDMTQARGHASFDPPTGQTFLHSGGMSISAMFGNGDEIASFLDNYSSYISGTTSPPPKSL